MKKLSTLCLLAGLCHSAWAGSMEVDDAWARTTVPGMTMGGAFMEIQNGTGRDDALTGGSTPVAERVEVHTHTNDNGVMRMREVPGGVPLPKGRETALQPGGYHIMFMGLKRPLKAGDTFPLTLKFKHAKPQTVKVEVKTAPRTEQHEPHGHHGSR